MNINLKKLTERVKPRGILHVGANTCQELPLYLECGINRRIWIEPNINLDFPEGERVINIAVSDRVVEKDMMYLSNNNGESSSLLRPKKHIELYREIDFSQKYQITDVTTLQHVLDSYYIFTPHYNYLVLDVQGAELRALKGLGVFANHFDVIITEAYTEELYEGCGKLEEIVEHLENYNLVEFAEESGKGWGDAAFIRKDL